MRYAARQQEAAQEAVGKYSRARVETSRGDPPRFRSCVAGGRSSRKEIERAADEIAHLEAEMKRLEDASSDPQQPRIRELKREIKKREQMAGATLAGSEAHA